MQNNNRESFTDILAEAFSEVQSKDKKSREKESARKKLETRRAIEDYQEFRRLKEVIGDFDFE